MAAFAGKPATSADKVRGGHCTPEPVARFLVAGAGPARVRTIHLGDAEGLAGADLDVDSAPALREQEKWTTYRREPGAIRLLRGLKESPTMTRLGAVADVNAGIVTGRNTFFTCTDPQARGLTPHCVPLVSRSSRLTGPVYDDDRRAGDVAAGHRTWLLEAPPEPAGVHRGYKCSPRLTVNAVGATSTDTVHGVRLRPGADRPADPAALAAVLHNSATFAFAEIMGRSYGGGILELAPAEAEQLPVPPPACAGGELAAVLDLVDHRVLVERLGWAADVVAGCRAAWSALRDRRTGRVPR